LITYPSPGRRQLTAEGAKVARKPENTDRPVADFVRDTLSGPQQQVFDELLRRPSGLDRETICERLGWNPTAGHIRNIASSLRTMEIVEYPTPGSIKIVDWVLR
jgi:hypothetical protein